MAKRQQVTKLLAVMAMTSSPALAGPEHDHGHAHGSPASAARAPAPKPDERPVSEPRTRPSPPRQATRAAAPAAAASPATPTTLEAILALFGVARPRELPDGSPAPGNVASRAPARSRR
jgi:hypothetical protein